MERQQVNFVIFVERAQLDSGDYANAQSLARCARRWNSSNRIVVSERQRLQAAALGGLDYLLWWESAVGGGRVRMQVDECRPARLCAHRA